jgi:hypothetical protein
MQLDPEYLRQHYASLSDEALLAVNRAELVEMAQATFDDEVNRRELAPRKRTGRVREPDLRDGDAEVDAEPADAADKPGWLEEAAEIYSVDVRDGSAPRDAEKAREALEAAGIPCYLEVNKIPQDLNAVPATHYWRLMVPGNLNMRATSVLERQIFNAEFEENWKRHLETLSDEEVRALDPQAAFCGLFDRVERVNRVYEEELERRRLNSESRLH